MKQTPKERTRESSRRRNKWKGGKQFIRYRVESDDFKDTEQHGKRCRYHKKGPVRNKECNIRINNKLEGINSRLDEAEDQISNLEDKVEENTQAEQQKGKIILKMKKV